MKIVHVADYFMPELGYQDTFLALAELRQGHDVTVITSDRYRPFENYSETVGPLLGPRMVGPRRRLEEGIDVIRLPVSVEVHFRCWLRGLAQAVVSLSPDVVIVHGVATGQASRLARIRARQRARSGKDFKLIVDDHMTPGRSTLAHSVAYRLFRRLGVPSLLREADGLVAVTESTKQFMIDNYGVTPTDVAVIPLGADTSLFSHLADRREVLRRELGYRDHDVVFLYAGKMISSKGIDILVEGALEAMERDSSVKVLLVGDGPQDFTRMLADRIEAAGRTAGFTWHRPVPNSQLPDLFSAADVGVWPARSSLAMIEAQSCGLPIVVSSFPAAAERVQAGNGLIFEEDDASGLANAMLELLDASRRREMGRRGRSLVERDRDYTVLSDRFLALASVGPAGVDA